MKIRFLSLAVAMILGSTVSQAAPMPKEKAKNIDVAILIDTSGSMEGLIESAKIKIWTIVNDLAKIQPVPNLRVALYQYGNDGIPSTTGWVKKELDLTVDLDEAYKKLNTLRTNGGTEYVARVSQSALKELKWSEENDALKMIFVCGNEPVDQDKQVTLKEVSEMAKKQGVFINTIFCGSKNDPDAPGWKEFATMCGGSYAVIDQNRAQAEVVIHSPFDKELNELNVSLNKTFICYGKEGKGKQLNQSAQDSNAQKAAPSANFDRINTKVSGLYKNDSWDIIDRMKNDPKFDFKTLKEEEMDDELKKIKPEERETFLKKKGEEREAVRKKIQDLSEKRGKYVAEEVKKQPKGEQDKAFDAAVKTTLREQAEKKGIKIPE